MEKYSHGAFQVTGYKVNIPNRTEEASVISSVFDKFMTEKIGDSVLGKEYESLHTIYFNIKEPNNLASKSFDMLIGYITKEDAIQTNSLLTTITIPAQDYMYTIVKGDLPSSLAAKWIEINNMTKEELPRAFGYDMDTWNADMSEVTVAVSVNK